MRYSLPIIYAMVLCLLGASSARASLGFDVGPSLVVHATTVDVPIYLKETGTNRIATEGGLFSAGLALNTVSGSATVLDLTRSGPFDSRVNGSTTSFNVAPPVTLWEQQDSNFGSPAFTDASGRILLATARLKLTGVSFTFDVADFGASDQTISYAGIAFDGDIAPGRFTVTVPEPSSLGPLGPAMVALFSRRRNGSTRAKQTRRVSMKSTMCAWMLAAAFFAFSVSTFAQTPSSGSTARSPDQSLFVHPGGLHTQQDLDRMKAKVAAREHPWIDGWEKLIADPKAQNTYRTAAKANMGVSRQRAQDDATAAYLNAMRWYISGDTSFAECAVRNLNAWSAAVNVVPSGNDQPGLGGIPIGTFALAAEVLRTYPGWVEADQARFKRMLLDYFYPAVNDFLTNHRGTHPSNYWANWDAANILSLVAIGVFCDDRAKFDQGVGYFKDGVGMGSIGHAVPFLYPGSLGQWQESGRDHAHALGGLGLLAETCQVAWNQGVDLFAHSDNRLLAGAEYEAQYNQWIGVPYTFYTNANNANQYYISANYHGRLGNCEFYELLYNHYVVRKGLKAPNVKRFAELLRPEGGNVDIMGYGTLTFTLDAAASPYPASPAPPVPMDVVAKAAVGRVYLKWSPAGAYSTQGYNVSRAATRGGPYTSIFSTTTNTSPEFTDTKVENGTAYYYVVSAINQAGMSSNSAEVSASPVADGELSDGWAHADIGTPSVAGKASYADVSNNTLIVSGEGAGIGGTEDSCHYAYKTATGDFTITGRLTDKLGPVNKVGLMMRESTAPNATALAITLGEVGGRQARFGTRSSAGGKWTTQLGNDYTWVPVWFRLQRTGETFTASQSSDGVTWFVIGKSTVPMKETYLVGVAATSGKKGELATVTFDNVMTAVKPPAPPATPGRLVATPAHGSIQLTWTKATAELDGFKVERSFDNELFYEIADLDPGATGFVNTGLSAKPYYYRLRAYNTGGYSAYSNTTDATPKSGYESGAK